MVNFEEYTTKIPRSAIEQGYKEPKGNCIVMPPVLYNKVCNYIEFRKGDETSGVLFCSTQKHNEHRFYIVESVIEIGRGSTIRVKPDNDKRDAILALKNENPEMRLLEFHTHTIKTGSMYSNSFSNGDYRSFSKQLEKYPHYTHVLFTPTHILTFGKEKPTLVLPNNWTYDVVLIHRKWTNKFNEKLNQT